MSSQHSVCVVLGKLSYRSVAGRARGVLVHNEATGAWQLAAGPVRWGLSSLGASPSMALALMGLGLLLVVSALAMAVWPTHPQPVPAPGPGPEHRPVLLGREPAVLPRLAAEPLAPAPPAGSAEPEPQPPLAPQVQPLNKRRPAVAKRGGAVGPVSEKEIRQLFDPQTASAE